MEHDDQQLSSLSCYACKRRKVKCNRGLPSCSLCVKHGGSCEYPTSSKRPGPKLGSTQKKRRGVSIASLVSPSTHSPSINTTTSGTLGCSPEVQRIDPALRTARQGHDLRSRVARRSSAWSADGSQIPSPNSVSSSRRSGANRQPMSPAPDFSRIMYPSHETQTRPQTPSQSHDSPDQPVAVSGITVDIVCKGLQISRNVYTYLMKLYFSNMTSFTLFKPNSIEAKFAFMKSHIEAEALVATIFAFSARFHPSDKQPGRVADCPTPSYFANIASKKLQSGLDLYEDTIPPFHLLQAAVLDAFYHISKSVRSRSWRYLGQAIRLGYDLKLHLLDIHSDRDADGEKDLRDLERWSLLEERRRAWWALWEMDVFASTIRRLPLAIDWTQNFTFLPVPDKCWFEGIYQESCFLAPDPCQRWKNMAQVVNTSPRAWFIVINSLMHDAQLLVYNPLPVGDTSFESKKDSLAIIANALYCTTSSLPPELIYEGQALDFHTKGSPQDINCRQFHCDVYSIHLMTQLVRFMIDHHIVCAQVAAAARAHANDEARPSDSPSWSNYMKAAENIVTIVRNSAHDHIKYVNPFLTNTLWFAAASQIACKVVGPSSRAETLAASNYDLLALTIQRYISFWCSTDILKPRLERIETALKNLMTKEGQDATAENNFDREDSGVAGVNHSGTSQPLTQAQVNNHPFGQQGFVGSGGMGMEAVQSPFLPLFPTGNDPNALAQQVVFDDLEHFLPYGVDDLWASQRILSAW